jgi:hypothetical protein
MRKFIHSSFELDLSGLKLSDVQQNSFFYDSFFSKYSFPSEIDLEEDLDIATGFISRYTSSPQTYFEGYYYHNDTVEKAILEIEQMSSKLSIVIRFGFEELPSFSKKLAELPLEKFNLPTGQDIYAYANSILNQSWPEVNFNFPMVHTNKYDTADYPFDAFEKTINKRVAGQFLKNYYDTTEEVSVTKNIMQPLPNWLYILQAGLLADGYTLAGSILDDELLQKALLFSTKDYYKDNRERIEQSLYVKANEYNTLDTSAGTTANPRYLTTYIKEIVVDKPGRYNITGTFTTAKRALATNFIKITKPNDAIAEFSPGDTFAFQYTNDVVEIDSLRKVDIDVNFTIPNIVPTGSVMRIAMGQFGEGIVDDRELLELNINFIASLDSSGNFIPLIENENKIDLTKAVPDITFADYVKVIKNYLNYDITKVENKNIYFDKIPETLTSSEVVDLSDYEIKYPLRKFNQGISFLNKFADVDDEKYKYDQVFQDMNGVTTSGFTVDDEKTSTIEVNMLPLPIETISDIKTAYSFENNDQKCYLVAYNGLQNSLNISQANTNYLMPNIYNLYWKDWIKFRIFSQQFTWNFLMWNEKYKEIMFNNRIFAYGKHHIVKLLNRTEIQPDLFEVEIETESQE